MRNRCVFSIFWRALPRLTEENIDALSLSALTHIILDLTYQDAKKRTLLDIPETRDEVFRTILGADSVQDALRRNKIQLVLF